jgi:hypothetical protein
MREAVVLQVLLHHVVSERREVAQAYHLLAEREKLFHIVFHIMYMNMHGSIISCENGARNGKKDRKDENTGMF